MIEGKSKNVRSKEILMPTLIIQPKLMTGKISHNIKEENPAMVVKVAYRHGFAIETTESSTS